MTQFKKIDVWFKWFGAFVAVIGIVFYFVDKKLDRDLSRETRSFNLTEAYYSGDVLKVRRTLQNFWVTNSEEFAPVANQAVTKRALATVLTETGALKIGQAENRPELVEAVGLHMGFFDQMHVCIKNDVCAATSSKQSFCEIAKRVNNQYGGFVERINRLSGSNLMGDGLRQFVKRCARESYFFGFCSLVYGLLCTRFTVP